MAQSTTKPSRPGKSAGRSLARRLTPGSPQPDLAPLIAACTCSEPVRAGMYLINGDWGTAHKVAQEIETPLGAHWHALAHRHEPDVDNSKYWLGRVGDSPIYPALAEAARKTGHEDVAPNGRWNPERFADCFADPRQEPWIRELDALEQRLLLEHCLAQEAGPA